jgi:hypothetical protein
MKSVIEEIADERQRQIDVEGWLLSHDDQHETGELARAAACYAGDKRKFNRAAPPGWPWDQSWWKPANKRRDLIKAAALIVAEIERLDRASTD